MSYVICPLTYLVRLEVWLRVGLAIGAAVGAFATHISYFFSCLLDLPPTSVLALPHSLCTRKPIQALVA